LLRYFVNRLILGLGVLLAVSAISFFLLHASGDLATAMAGEGATAADVARIRSQFGLDRPVLLQFGDWLAHVARGDFGRSLFYPDSVASLIAARLPVTAILAVLALGIAGLIAIPLGVLGALWPGGWIDGAAVCLAVLGQAIPGFWLALLLIMGFGVALHWLPISGSNTPAHFVLPAAALGWISAPVLMRLTRAGMVDVLRANFIRTARAKGLSEYAVLVRHALRIAVVPVVALAAVQLGALLAGSVVIETVFAVQGIGQLAWESISRKDFPVVQGVLLVVAACYVGLSLLADLLNAWLDPRIVDG
jgi:peptide/nickel transport system permease protein